MDTVRIARDFGTVSQLLPPGLTLLDSPYVVVNAIRMAVVFLSWRENLRPKEVPPKGIWLDGKKLEKWFKDIEQKREDEMKSKDNSGEWDGEMKRNSAIDMLLVDDDD